MLGDWSICSSTCKKTRTVECQDISGNPGTIGTDCTGAQPEKEENCNESFCPCNIMFFVLRKDSRFTSNTKIKRRF